MAIVAWPEWLPDQADFSSAGSPVIKNCVPLTPGSYGPMPSAVPWSDNTLDEPCQGSYSLKAPDAQVYIFAGDRQKLYMVAPTTRVLANASRTTGGPYATPPTLLTGGHWSMTSFGDRVIATNGVDPMQTMLLGDTHFAALQPGETGDGLVRTGSGNAVTTATPEPVKTRSGAPNAPMTAAPIAKYVATVKDFVMVGNTTDNVDGPRPYRVWWSAINSPDNWPTPGTVEALQLQSDFQDLMQTDLGNVTQLVSGFAPGSDCVIFCSAGLYSASYVGPPLIFQFRVIQGSSGTVSPRSVIMDHARDQSGGTRPVCYYWSGDGLAAFDGNASFPIGAQKFDHFIARELDDQYLSYIQATRDPRSRSVIWGYPTIGSGGLISRLLVYNWELSRATIIELEPAVSHLEWLTTAMYGTSYNLDNIDHLGSVDTIQPSFDDPFWSGNQAARLSMFDRNHRLAIGGGPPLAPTLETGESQPAPGRRSWVRNSRPLIDGGAATIAVGHRDRLTDPVTWEPPVAVNQIGECPQRVTGRYVRYRLTMPAGETWTHLQGVEVDPIPEASRR